MSRQINIDYDRLGRLDSYIWRHYLREVMIFSDLDLVSFIQSMPIFASLMLAINNLQIIGLLIIDIKTTGLKSIAHSTALPTVIKALTLELIMKDHLTLFFLIYFLVNSLALGLFVVFTRLAQQRFMPALYKRVCYILMIWYTLNIFILTIPALNLCAYFLTQAASKFFSVQLIMGLLLLLIVPIQLQMFKVYNNDFRYYPLSLFKFIVKLSNLEPKTTRSEALLLLCSLDDSSNRDSE